MYYNDKEIALNQILKNIKNNSLVNLTKLGAEWEDGYNKRYC